MSLGSFLFGRKDKLKRLPTMAPFQEQALQGLFQNPIQQSPVYGAGSSYIQQLLNGSPEAFQNFESPYLQQFEQQIIPKIAERFAGAGTGSGGLNSSALFNSLAQAGRGLQTDLAGLRSGLQMQAAQMALPYAQQPYSNALSAIQVPPYGYSYQPGTPGLLGSALGGIGQGAGLGFGLASGGPLMNYFGSYF